MSKTAKAAGGWAIAVTVALIGVFWGGTEHSRTQSPTGFVDMTGQEAFLTAPGFQDEYAAFENKYEQAELKRVRLEQGLDRFRGDSSSTGTNKVEGSSVLLEDFDFFQAGGSIIVLPSATDMFGGQYTNVLTGRFKEDYSRRDYCLNGEFKTLKGRLALSGKHLCSGPAGEITIIGDGKTLKVITLDRDSKTEDFEVSLAGVTILRLEVCIEPFAFLANATLYK